MGAAARAEIQETVRIEYTATGAAGVCPNASEFVAAVSARTASVRFANGGEAARSFVVSIADGADGARGARGRLVVHDRTGDLQRDIEGASCAEVADTLALIVALAIDPKALATTATTAPSPAPAPPPSPAVSTDPVPTSSTAPIPVVSPAPPDERARAAPREPVAARPVFSLGAGFAWTSGVAPGTLVGPDVFAERRAASDAWYAHALRLSFARTATDALAEPGGTARFVWTAARLDGCVRGLRVADFRVSPCAQLELGALEAFGGAVDHPRSASHPWLAAGAALRARRYVIGALFAEATLALRAALLPERFYFEPNASFYRVPPIGGALGVGVGASF
jgi:hypothetical protein